MRHRVSWLATSLLLPALLVGCSSTPPGPPSPAPSQPVSGSTGQPAPDGVPKVADPADISHFQQAPCDTLSPAQAQELIGSAVTSKPDPNGPAGPACSWAPPERSQPSVGVVFSKVSLNGMADLYQKKDTVNGFKELDPIQGYPSIVWDTSDDDRSTGRCFVMVGTSDHQVMQASVLQSKENVGKKDPCATAYDVATKAVATMRGEADG